MENENAREEYNNFTDKAKALIDNWKNEINSSELLNKFCSMFCINANKINTPDIALSKSGYYDSGSNRCSVRVAAVYFSPDFACKGEECFTSAIHYEMENNENGKWGFCGLCDKNEDTPKFYLSVISEGWEDYTDIAPSAIEGTINNDFAAYIDDFVKIHKGNLNLKGKIVVCSDGYDKTYFVTHEQVLNSKDLTTLIHNCVEAEKGVLEYGADKEMDKLVNDADADVRAAVAKQGRPQDLKVLANDDDFDVRDAVRVYKVQHPDWDRSNGDVQKDKQTEKTND